MSVIDQYIDIKERVGCNDIAAAILVLAENVEPAFSRRGAENFGHELAMALKNVLQESQINVSVDQRT